jgi:hypothetical protein
MHDFSICFELQLRQTLSQWLPSSHVDEIETSFFEEASVPLPE